MGKQKGVEVALFAPLDFSERLLGFRAVLEWAKDFKMMPQRALKDVLEKAMLTLLIALRDHSIYVYYVYICALRGHVPHFIYI